MSRSPQGPPTSHHQQHAGPSVGVQDAGRLPGRRPSEGLAPLCRTAVYMRGDLRGARENSTKFGGTDGASQAGDQMKIRREVVLSLAEYEALLWAARQLRIEMMKNLMDTASDEQLRPIAAKLDQAITRDLHHFSPLSEEARRMASAILAPYLPY